MLAALKWHIPPDEWYEKPLGVRAKMVATIEARGLIDYAMVKDK